MNKLPITLKIALDCRHYVGDMPCKYHKSEKKTCTCEYYDPVKERILIIRLGALGDVIRTTPILTKLKEEYPNSHITWLTHTPEILPNIVDSKLKFSTANVLTLLAQEFDLLLNFDKEKESCSLAKLIKAKAKKGFTLVNGKCHPIDKDAEYKFLIGLDDGLDRKNTKSLPEQVFEIAGYEFDKKKYKYVIESQPRFNATFADGKNIIGLNTGCGSRWSTRIWPEHNWISLATELQKKGYAVLILGGEREDEKNKRIAEKSGAQYFGCNPLQTFISIVNLCSVVVTSVTLALHIAIGLDKKIVLFNNIFNKNEFELYDNGVVLEPDLACVGCYKSHFDDKCPVPNCMEEIKVNDVLSSIENLLQEKMVVLK